MSCILLAECIKNVLKNFWLRSRCLIEIEHQQIIMNNKYNFPFLSGHMNGPAAYTALRVCILKTFVLSF